MIKSEQVISPYYSSKAIVIFLNNKKLWDRIFRYKLQAIDIFRILKCGRFLLSFGLFLTLVAFKIRIRRLSISKVEQKVNILL